MAAPSARFFDWSRILISPKYLGIEKAPKGSMKPTSQTCLHNETQGRIVTTPDGEVTRQSRSRSAKQTKQIAGNSHREGPDKLRL